MHERFDAIVIGSGQAGPSLAARLANSGSKVALIEEAHLGGTCVNDGCTPTKTLVASARVAHMARRAGDFGVRIGDRITVDVPAVMARKDAVVNGSKGSLAAWLGSIENLTLVWGAGVFRSPKTLSVGDRILEGNRIFINTGGRPVIPDWPGLRDVDYLTNTSLMELTCLPTHLVIVGGSYVGLEFAQIYRRFGAEVTVMEYADDIIAREDADVRETVRAILESEGIVFHTKVRDITVARLSSGFRMGARAAGTVMSVEGSHLLVSIGRRPNSDLLDLEAAGVKTDSRGFISVDDMLQTSVPGIWALGDVNGHGAFTHTSYNDYEIVAANLLDGEQRRITDRITAYALFTDPPLARIGLTEAEVRARGRPALRGVMPMTRVARARERGETSGFMKVLVDAETKRILGAALVGIEADEVVHSLLDIMAAGAPYTVIQRCMHIHPTVSELIPTLLGQLEPLPAI